MPKSPKGRNWCFTLNNYTDEEVEGIESWECKGVAFGKEVGESGTPHLQGFVHFENEVTLKACRALSSRAHWERMRGSLAQNEAYCSKQDTLTIYGT